MSQDDPIAEIWRHLLSIQAIAALGAELRLRQERRAGDPVLRPRLQEAARAIHPVLPDGLGSAQEEAMVAAIGYGLSEAAALFADPAQTPGWRHEDPVLIDSIGRASRKIVHDLEAASADRLELRTALRRENGAFLDVGTGAAWLAIEAARVWPALRVVGIDIHEPALALARKNVAELGLEARVELRRQDVTMLEDMQVFTVAWLPLPFLPEPVALAALERNRAALVLGGWLALARYAAPAEHLPAAVGALRTVLSGGHPWTDSALEAALHGAGFGGVEHLPTAPVALTIAQL
ncbi:class I SAM-dependent methyltransferase [Microvirga yunnanensis]|uniref:class I SAM-dependent methyltransferase n=1 Tax=Microvirga yunnanensis TaxID=2953740 RepID=UPI0021C962F9|nr:class I SAM-dependent methyltransferase [Microvirga sp. HBU65207]